MPLRPLSTERAQSYREAGYWQENGLATIVAASPDRGALAITDHRGTLSFAELDQRVSAAAVWLLENTAPGQVIALQSRGRSDILVLHLACARTGRVLMPLSHVFTEAETDHLINIAQASVLVTAEAEDLHLERSAASYHDRHPSLRLVGSPSGEGTDFSLDEVLTGSGHSNVDPGLSDPDVAHLAMISSGTTQLPKVSLWTDNDLWFLLSQFRDCVRLVRSDVVLQIAPANTGSTGYVFPVLAPVLFGARSVMLQRWSPAAALDTIEQLGVTVATAVPTQMVKMLRLQAGEPRDVSTLRAFNNAGAKLEEEHARRVEAVFGCRIQTSFGASDGGVPVLTSVHDDEERRLRSVGRPLPGVDLRLVDENGNIQPAGVPGEVRWRTPSKTFGYLNSPAQDDVAFVDDGWYSSGDLGVQDEDGHLYIVGRVRDMIIRGGQNIHPGEIEELALGHSAVAEIAVVGLPDEVYGERAAAFVLLERDTSLTLEEMCDFLRNRGLAKHKLPERLFFVNDLPRNSGGKVDKASLRTSASTSTR